MSLTDTAHSRDRLPDLVTWLRSLGEEPSSLQPLRAEASRRRYYRFETTTGSRIAVDSPPSSEDNGAFLRIADELQSAGVRVPHQYHADLKAGFLVMEDFGDTTLEFALARGDNEALYFQAIDLLAAIHRLPCAHRQRYDHALIKRELDLFTQHYLSGGGTPLQDDERAAWLMFTDWIASEFDASAPTWTHRDFHCRNIMVLGSGELGVIDFQGALAAPAGYDLASLLYDCYVDLPEPTKRRAVSRYARTNSTLTEDSLNRSIDLLGLQRHLKCLGLFVRLAHESHQHHYLSALPRTAQYAARVAAAYPEAEIVSALLSRCPVERFL